MMRSRGRRSGGIPCGARRPGSEAKAVPGMVVVPRLEARITRGERGVSRARVR